MLPRSWMELQEWVWIYPVGKNALIGQGCVYAGTFKLTDEAILEPPLRLEKELSRLKLDPLSFITVKHGETKCL
jgi:hypothetical protein